MSEEYGNADLVRNNSDVPKRCKSVSKPKVAKVEALSFENLKNNISKGRIEAKYQRYNREYDKLKAIAKEVNLGRKALEEGKNGAEDYVKDAIKVYNAQAEKLAKIGAKIIAYDDAMQRKFIPGASAKAIRVPGALMKVLRGLTKAGRLQNDLEKTIASKIAANMEKVVGQKPTDTLDVAALNKLDIHNVARDVKVAAGVIAPPSSDVVTNDAKKEADKDKAEKGKDEQKVSKETGDKAAAAKKVAEEAVKKAAEAKRKDASSSDLKGSYSNRRKQEEEAKVAFNSGELFDLLNVIKNSLTIGKVELKDKNKFVEVIVVKTEDGKSGVLKPTDLGIDDEKEARKVYNENLKLIKLAHNWNSTFAKSLTEEGKVPVGAYDNDRRKVFDFVINSVNNGLSTEVIIEKVKTDLGEEEAKLVAKFMTAENVALMKDVIKVVKDIEQEKNTSKATNNNDEAKKIVDETIKKLALAKYGMKKTNAVDGENKTVDEPEKDVPAKKEPEKDENKQNDGSYASKFSELVDEIARLKNKREELERLLGDRAKEQLAGVDRIIDEKLAQISEITNVEGLGNKNGDKKKDIQENAVSEENINADVNTNPNTDNNNNVNNEEVDLEHADDINWWMNMSPILDDPDQELLSRMRVAADKDRRRERFEANSVERSRAILGHVLSNGQRVYSDAILESIEDPVNELNLIRENAPNAYNEAEAAYWQEVRDRNRNVQRVVEPSTSQNSENIIGEEVPIISGEDEEQVINPVAMDEENVYSPSAVAYQATSAPPGPPGPPNGDDNYSIPVVGREVNSPTPPGGDDSNTFSGDGKNSDELVAEAEAPRENIEYIMDLISNGGTPVYEDNVGVLDRAYFDEHPELYDEMGENYAVPAGPEFWNLVAQGMNPVTNSNALVEGIRHDRRAEAARDFLDFAYCLDEETLNAMSNGEQERTPLEVVNSLPREEVLGNLDQYARYLEARRERIEAKRDAARGSAK